MKVKLAYFDYNLLEITLQSQTQSQSLQTHDVSLRIRWHI